MGWTPAEVRACSLADFVAALDGWMASKGLGGSAPDADEVRELLAMLEDD